MAALRSAAGHERQTMHMPARRAASQERLQPLRAAVWLNGQMPDAVK